ncbi:MAG: GNAT family N-acetyltransferase [Nitrosotalea sp.]
MTRKALDLNPPYREIEYPDGKKEFWNRLTPKNQIDLSCLVDMNVGDQYVIVYEIDEKILGFMTFLDQGDHLHLDLIERNELIEESHGVGFNLMMLLEIIASNFEHSRITLSSTQENIQYYQALGYKIIGSSFDIPDYGSLTPMEKRF